MQTETEDLNDLHGKSGFRQVFFRTRKAKVGENIAEPSLPSMCLWFLLLMRCQIIGVLADRKLRKAEAISCTSGS